MMFQYNGKNVSLPFSFQRPGERKTATRPSSRGFLIALLS